MSAPTPKTVIEAIENAQREFAVYLDFPSKVEPHPTYRDILKRHLNDYLAQRFGAAVISAESSAEEQRLLDLLKEITNDSQRS